ncbi:hypothetical protein, partial [Stenotrophomonas maltophilia]|uniref:hypothetical protein n=1 Tax=Stenotrophomonas maltophilia TaxID=40324 RepID=UPI001953CDAB
RSTQLLWRTTRLHQAFWPSLLQLRVRKISKGVSIERHDACIKQLRHAGSADSMRQSLSSHRRSPSDQRHRVKH